MIFILWLAGASFEAARKYDGAPIGCFVAGGGAPIGVLGLAGTSKVDCARGTSLLRRSRTKLVPLFYISSASPRNDGASIGVLHHLTPGPSPQGEG